jgi:16S rRNA (guanine527-N7)-methyltransferase
MKSEQLPAIHARLCALAARYELPDAAGDKLASLHELLVREPLAPTAVRDPVKVVDDHLADALVALECEQVRVASTIADLGSGPGLPGLPLAIVLPSADVALVESNARKCAFLELAIESCALLNAHVVHARVESWVAGLGKMDVVTARALAPLPVVAEYAAPLLKIRGCAVVWRGGRDPADEASAGRAADELGLEVIEPRRVLPYPDAVQRYLHVLVKVRPTPEGYPRRPGIARKRPLGVAGPRGGVAGRPGEEARAPGGEARPRTRDAQSDREGR